MPVDLFEERLAKIRQRFASTLEGKIANACDTLPQMLEGAGYAAPQLADTYRQIHGMCGVGPTVGFVATGKAARDAEMILLEAFRIQRGLSEAEGQLLQKALDALRAAAQLELQSMSYPGG